MTQGTHCTNATGTGMCHYHFLSLQAGHGMEWKFRYRMWKMPEWNGMEDFKNGTENNLPYQFHARFCSWHLRKICAYRENERYVEAFTAYHLSVIRS